MPARDPSGSGRIAPPPEGARTEKTGVQRPPHTHGGHNGVHIPPFLETAVTQGINYMAANGGTSLNPMGFPGYDQLYTGSYTTYRWMLKHPIIALVRSIRMGIIAANTWEYEKVDRDDNVPDEWLKWTKITFDRIRQQLIWDIMAEGHDMGWAGGEPVWSYDPFHNRYRLTKVKPLLPDITDVLIDDGGNPIGLRNYTNRNPGTGMTELAMPYKAFHYAYQSRNGYVYGQSWLENLRNTAWKGWLDSAQQLQRLGTKISGTVTIITSPAGTFPGPVDAATGIAKPISFRENAIEVIKALSQGAAGAWFPSLGLQPDGKGGLDAMKVMAQLIGKSMTTVDVKDFSGNSAGIASILEKMKHEEELMFAGGLRPARVGLEAEHGSRADAGEHTNTATFNAEDDDEKFAVACQPLVDGNLVMNFTPKAAGRVRIKPPSLVDRKTSIYKALLLGLVNNEEVTNQLAVTPGLMDSLLQVLDVVFEGKFDTNEFAKRIEEKNKAQAQPKPTNPEPQGGRPPQE